MQIVAKLDIVTGILVHRLKDLGRYNDHNCSQGTDRHIFNVEIKPAVLKCYQFIAK